MVFICFFEWLSFSYLNKLPLFQFAAISLVRNEVICFSTFFHTLQPKLLNFCGFRLCVSQKLKSVLFAQVHKPPILFFS